MPQVLSGAISLLVVLTGAFFLRYWMIRDKIGPALWSFPGEHRARGFIFCAMAVGQMVSWYGRSGRPLEQRLLPMLLAAAWFCGGVLASFPPSLLRVGQGGISTGLLVLEWAEITAWAWGPSDGWDDLQGLTAMNIASERQSLYLWTSSNWRFFYNPRPSRPVKTQVKYSKELDALLVQFAPASRRLAEVRA